MQIDELLIKKKPKKKKVLKEEQQPDIYHSFEFKGIEFVPPFSAVGIEVHDTDNQVLCMCINEDVAKELAELLTETRCSIEVQ